MSESNGNDDWLKAVYTIGEILLLTPTLMIFLLGLIGNLVELITGPIRGGNLSEAWAYVYGSMLSGLIAMVYSKIKMRRKKRSDNK